VDFGEAFIEVARWGVGQPSATKYVYGVDGGNGPTDWPDRGALSQPCGLYGHWFTGRSGRQACSCDNEDVCVKTGGSARAHEVIERARDYVIRAARMPASGLVLTARLVLVGALAVTPSLVVSVRSPARAPAVRPLAAVFPHPADTEGPSAAWSLAPGFAVSGIGGPPPPAVVSSPGPLGIPALALMAYRNAERVMAQAVPRCGVSWNLLAGIGRIESMHAFGGATDARGLAIKPIYGPALDGTLPGNEIIALTPAVNGRVVYARAVGPMQFLPDTWTRYAADGDRDGQTDPQNLFDATLGAARYLCDGGLNLRDQSQMVTAVMRYNNSMPYTQNVLGWAAAYVTGVLPMNLPRMDGPVPPIGNRRVVVGSANVARTEHGTPPRPGETSNRDSGNPGDDGLGEVGNRGDDGVGEAGGQQDAGSPRPRVSSSQDTGATNAGDGGSSNGDGSSSGTGNGAHSGNGGDGGAANVGNDGSPVVKVGDGRNGGAR
jgi:Transglycosylase SLT domain